MGAAQTISDIKTALTSGERFELTAGQVLEFLPETDDTGYIRIGNNTYSMDLYWYATGSTQYVHFDKGNARVQFEDVDISLGDNDSIKFGDGSDAVFKWNGTYLECGPASGMWAGAPSPADPRYMAFAHEFFDDFDGPAIGSMSIIPTGTATATATSTATSSTTASATTSVSKSTSSTATQTVTSTGSGTKTDSPTATVTSTATDTQTATSTQTQTPSATSTSTSTSTATATGTQ